MTSSKNTKRALLASVLSVALCAAMLIGSTFAWFTDSVTSAGNIIKSGTLDVTMEWANGTSDPTKNDIGQWQDASEGAIFDYDLWEPGYTEVRHVKISNIGTLALKYEVRIAATGEVSELADVIDVYYIKDGDQITDRTQLNDSNKIGTLTEVLAKPYAAKGNLLGQEGGTVDSDIATIALKMQEGAGNEYQGKSIGSEFAIQLVATQDTVESDSFGDDYDAGAQYEKEQNLDALIEAGYTPVYSADELTKALEFTDSEETDAKIVLAGDISMMNLTPETTITIPAGKNVTLDLNGSQIYAKETTSSGVYGFINVSNTSTLVLNDSTGNGKIFFEYDGGSANYAGKATVLCQGEMIMNGGTIAFEGNGHEILSFGIDLRPNAWGADYEAVASFTMNGGSIIGDDECEAIRLANSSGGNVPNAKKSLVKCIINDGTIYGWDAIFVQQIDSVFKPFEVEINGGNLTGVNYAVRIYNAYTNWSYADPDRKVVNTVTINGGALTDGGDVLPVVDGVAIRTPNGTYEQLMETVAIDSIIDKTENIPTP